MTNRKPLTFETLIWKYEQQIQEKKDFLEKKWHNDVVEGVYIQLQKSLEDIRELQKNYSK